MKWDHYKQIEDEVVRWSIQWRDPHTAFHQVVGAEHDVTWETWRFETKVYPAKTVSWFFQKTCQIDSNCQFDFCFLVILQCSSRSFEDANLWDGSMLLIITFQPWNQGKVKQLRHSCTHSLRWWIGRAIVQQWCRGSKSWNRKVVTLLPRLGRLGVQFLGIMRCPWMIKRSHKLVATRVVCWCTDGDLICCTKLQRLTYWPIVLYIISYNIYMFVHV